ncbi:MAG: hypothetical protein ABIY70_13430 [Capsulimonas sp.]|uniref:hypothetical protein n=1 Tax=Capsulimonas sp. TaxID=2494211 RepID=UPI0032653E81
MVLSNVDLLAISGAVALFVFYVLLDVWARRRGSMRYYGLAMGIMGIVHLIQGVVLRHVDSESKWLVVAAFQVPLVLVLGVLMRRMWKAETL